MNPDKRTANQKANPRIKKKFINLEKQKDNLKAKKLRYVK